MNRIVSARHNGLVNGDTMVFFCSKTASDMICLVITVSNDLDLKPSIFFYCNSIVIASTFHLDCSVIVST